MELAISKLKTDIKELKKLSGFPRIKKRIESYKKAIDYLEECDSQKADEKESVLPISDVSGSTSFKDQLINDFIPRIEAMAEKERLHLHYLIDNDAPTEFIQMSQKTHFHFLDRIKEYKEYAERI